MRKHTPGPWQVNSLNVESHGLFRVDHDSGGVVCQWKTSTVDAELLANATLIAASPKMLEALKDAEQAFVEIKHAYCRPDWFTGGEPAAMKHLIMWQQKGIDAVRDALKVAQLDPE